MFLDIVDRTKSLCKICIETSSWKKLNKLHFSKGLVHGFDQKFNFFFYFFILAKIGLENVFGVILDIKKPF